MFRANSERNGCSYLDALSKELGKEAYLLRREEEAIEIDILMDKSNSDNMSEEEYREAKLLGYNV